MDRSNAARRIVTPSDRMNDRGDTLFHYGIKGMKWGVRRSDAQLNAASGRGKSDDAKAADAARAKVNRGGTKSLSNKELQGLINRMNLERQYSQMTSDGKTSMDRGLDRAARILKLGKTLEDTRKFLQTPTGKAIKTSLKGAFMAAKVGVGAFTGGPAGAAAAGASLVVRRPSNHYSNGPNYR